MVRLLQELFIMYLTKLAQRNGDNENDVKYADLAAVVQRKASMEFLHDIVPKKIKFKEYLAMTKGEKIVDDGDIL
jgi:chromatin accessibility complex protein 1